MVSWHDVVAVCSFLLSVLFGVLAALSRETIGELKRRLALVESNDAMRAKEVAALDERSKGMTESLKRIEEQMVPRAEWEARHRATDDMLTRILEKLDEGMATARSRSRS